MRRSELEHAVRAATRIIQQDQVIIIGSQAILGTWTEEELPAEATFSEEVDICPMSDDDAETLATMLDAAIGEWSDFHQTHKFYVQGVGRNTAVLPKDWEYRLVPVRNANTDFSTGLCLDPLDLCAAKLIAGREKDYAFVLSLLQASRLTSPSGPCRTDPLDRRRRSTARPCARLGNERAPLINVPAQQNHFGRASTRRGSARHWPSARRRTSRRRPTPL